MNLPRPPRQLRLIIETDDFDEAVRFYRDVLGTSEQPAFATDGDDPVSILHAGAATIELATPTHVRTIDAIERAGCRRADASHGARGGRHAPRGIRLSRNRHGASGVAHGNAVSNDQRSRPRSGWLVNHIPAGTRNAGAAAERGGFRNR
ncbi:hypothetical protein [Mycetocola zhadangensis]|uniref:hypothetical protein n=1 Tax=Mycetocola zhadangensis TaxID=1164595 RepID=UPI001C7D7ABF|nr:hypothetical protein [Mycetocola zhadangensis]